MHQIKTTTGSACIGRIAASRTHTCFRPGPCRPGSPPSPNHAGSLSPYRLGSPPSPSHADSPPSPNYAGSPHSSYSAGSPPSPSHVGSPQSHYRVGSLPSPSPSHAGRSPSLYRAGSAPSSYCVDSAPDLHRVGSPSNVYCSASPPRVWIERRLDGAFVQQMKFKHSVTNIRMRYIPGAQTLAALVRGFTGAEIKTGITHKQAIAIMVKTLDAFYSLRGLGKCNIGWSEKQAKLESFAKDITGLKHLTSKEKNYVFVANVIRDGRLLQEAANFFISIAQKYKNDPRMKHMAPLRHAWPDDSMKAGSNTADRGYAGMARGVLLNVAERVLPLINRSGWTLADGLERFEKTMSELAEKNKLNEEDAAFILRGIGMLRDVMKAVKNTTTLDYIKRNEQAYNRIVGEEHVKSRADLSRVRFNNMMDLRIYELDAPSDDESGGARGPVSDRFRGDTRHWDYTQGTSGTTLDFCNFCMSETQGNKELSMRLMQVLYANWHYTAPDGMAHSQNESLNTMLEAFYQVHLTSPVMVPIKSEADVVQMKHMAHGKRHYAVAVTDDRRFLERDLHAPAQSRN